MFMEPVACYCTKARRVARLLTAAYDEALAPTGLKVTQFALLRMSARLEAPSITALAEATGLDRSTLGRNLRVLAKEGLVRLGPGEDERARSVTLTREGAAAMTRATPYWQAAQDELEGLLDAAERSVLDRILTRLADRAA